MELTIKERKIFAKVIMLIILLIIIGILIWQCICRDKISTYELDRNNSTNLVEEFGHGNINEKDTFYVKKRALSGEEIIPGKYILELEWKGEGKKFLNKIGGEEVHRSKLNYEYLNLIAYDVHKQTKEEYIDVLDLINENCQGFQYIGPYYVVLGEDGDCYIGFILENIPEKASDKIVNKWLFWNTRTEAVVILDGKETGFAFMDKGRTVQESEYYQEFEQTDWNSFYKRNNYNLEGKEGTTFYTESLNSAAGGVGITVDCEALPQENDILYTRFPELEKWKGAEDREAIVWVGGYPTVEEIMAMFEKQEL